MQVAAAAARQERPQQTGGGRRSTPAQVRGPRQLRHPRPRSLGLGSAGEGIWKRAAGGGGGAQRGLIGPSMEPSSQGGPCRLPRLRELRLPPVSQQPSKAPATSPSRGPAPYRDTAPAPVVSLVQTRSPKNPLLPKSSPQAPPDPSLLLCLGLVPEPPRCTVPRCSIRPDPCQLP